MGFRTSAMQTIDINGNVIPNIFEWSGATQKLNSAGTSAASTVFSTTENVIVRIVADAACHYKIAAAPTAASTDVYLPANTGEEILIQAGNKIAVIGTVNLYVTLAAQRV